MAITGGVVDARDRGIGGLDYDRPTSKASSSRGPKSEEDNSLDDKSL